MKLMLFELSGNLTATTAAEANDIVYHKNKIASHYECSKYRIVSC